MVGVEHHLVRLAGVAAQYGPRIPAGEVPYHDVVVVSSRSRKPAVDAERHAGDGGVRRRVEQPTVRSPAQVAQPHVTPGTGHGQRRATVDEREHRWAGRGVGGTVFAVHRFTPAPADRDPSWPSAASPHVAGMFPYYWYA